MITEIERKLQSRIDAMSHYISLLEGMKKEPQSVYDSLSELILRDLYTARIMQTEDKRVLGELIRLRRENDHLNAVAS